MFTKLPHRRAIIVDGGVYKEVLCYTAGTQGEMFVGYKGGFIKLLGKTNAANTYGTTSHAKVRWVRVEERYDI